VIECPSENDQEENAPDADQSLRHHSLATGRLLPLIIGLFFLLYRRSAIILVQAMLFDIPNCWLWDEIATSK